MTLPSHPSSQFNCGNFLTEKKVKENLKDMAFDILLYLKADKTKQIELDKSLMFSPIKMLKKINSSSPDDKNRLIEMVRTRISSDDDIKKNGNVDKINNDFNQIVKAFDEEKKLKPNGVRAPKKSSPDPNIETSVLKTLPLSQHYNQR
ncbi:MAG: hypothetical protein ACKOXJ_03900 [Alphaproteobacteria bacterium]